MFTYIDSTTSRICRLSGECVTDTAVVQPRLKPNPALKDFGLQPYSHKQPQSAVLMVSTPVNHELLLIY